LIEPKPFFIEEPGGYAVFIGNEKKMIDIIGEKTILNMMRLNLKNISL